MSFLKNKRLEFVEKWTAHKAFHFFSISRQLGTLIISVVLSNTNVGLSFIGNYEILLFIGITFTLFVSQGFLDSFNLLFEDAKNGSIFSVYLISSIVSLILFGILIGLESPIVRFLTSNSEINFYTLYCIHLFFDFNTWLTPIFLLRKKHRRSLTSYAIIINGAWILVVIIPAIFNWSLQFIFIGLIAVSLVKQFYLIGLLIKNSSTSIDWLWGINWLKKSVPFMGYALLGGFHLITDNWLVGHYFPGNKELFAIFRYGARELPMSIIITSAFATAAIPMLQNNSNSSLTEFKKKSSHLIQFLFLLAIFSTVFTKQIFAFVYGSAFDLSAHIFGVYLLVIISRVLILKPFIMTHNLNHWLVPIAISELLVNVVVSYFLVPILGITGIAWGTVVAYSYEKIFMILLLRFKKKLPLSQYVSLPIFTFYASVLIICYLVIF